MLHFIFPEVQSSSELRYFGVPLVERRLKGKGGGPFLAKVTGVSRDSVAADRVGPRADTVRTSVPLPISWLDFPGLSVSSNVGFWQLKAYIQHPPN